MFRRPQLLSFVVAVVCSACSGSPTAPTTPDPQALKISGRTVLNGRPATGIEVVFVWSQLRDTLASTVSESDGTYGLEALCRCRIGGPANGLYVKATFVYDGKTYEARANPHCTTTPQVVDLHCDPAKYGQCRKRVGGESSGRCPAGEKWHCSALFPDVCRCVSSNYIDWG